MAESSSFVPPVLQAVPTRFLNASTNPFSIDISIDGTSYLQNSSFGTISRYVPISDGFHTVTVKSSSGMKPTVFEGVFPFTSNQKTTFVIADSPSGAITLFPITGTSCLNQPARCGCYRVANMTFSGSSYDIQTPSKERIFRSVSFGQVSPYKQILAGSYHFFAAAPSGFSPVRELPIILQSFLTGSLTPSDSLADISVQIEAGKNYTTYLIGNTWSSFRLQTLTVEDN
ncbi:MAG: DUF4397 domain-containing protein [Lachnospiraceae bacterium]